MRSSNKVWLSCHFRRSDESIQKEDPSLEELGCWFCESRGGDLVFDTEFDTPVHIDCIRMALAQNETNQEAQLMKYLLQ